MNKIQLKNVRIDYPYIFAKGFYKGAENKKYTATLVLDKSNPAHVTTKKLIDDQIDQVLKKTKTSKSDFEEDHFCIKEQPDSWFIKVGNS